MIKPDCALCQTAGGVILWQDPHLRVIDACDPIYPGFTRVVWQAHIQEMTDLAHSDQQRLMQAVLLVEAVQRSILKPDKVNLAALGNVVPHLHWHIVPRWMDDPHFPQPVWANLPEADVAAQQSQTRRRTEIVKHIEAYHAALAAQLGAAFKH